MAEKAGSWVDSGFVTASKCRVVALTYMYGGLREPGWRIRVADCRAGAFTVPGLNQAIGFVRAFGGIWIGMGDEAWHESKPLASGSAIHRRTTSQVGNADEARQEQSDE
jgi:hypothetical protein